MHQNVAIIFHMCRAEEWAQAQVNGLYAGSSQDQADGFIHFSTAAQLAASAARHRAGQAGLVILAVAISALDNKLIWEESPSRQELFPHLYGPLPVKAVTAVLPLPLGADGLHVMPPLPAG